MTAHTGHDIDASRSGAQPGAEPDAAATVPGSAGSVAETPRGSTGARFWFLATLVATLVAGLIPLHFYHRYYFVNDTQTGAFGVWYHLGQEIRAGHIQLLNPHAWMAGNYVAEGQWGFFSPIVWVIGLLASVSNNALIFCTIVKFVFMLIGAGGAFVLARSFGADARWSAVAGVAVPLTGVAMFMDETAWVTELMIWSLLPWFWVALRRTVYQGRNPAPALVLAYLTITIGYVYGAIGVVFVLVGVGLERIITRDWAGVRRALLVGVLAGLVTITTYLPGILTAPVTQRQKGILNSGFLQPNLTGFAVGAQPTARPQMLGYWHGYFPGNPVMYIAWFLPLIVLIDWHAAMREFRARLDAGIVLVLFLLIMFAPSQVGPIRFPVRSMGSFAVVLLPLFVSLLTVARAPRTRARLYTAVGIILGTAYLAYGQSPMTKKSVFAATLVIAVASWGVWRSTPDAGGAPARNDLLERAGLSGRWWYSPSRGLPAGVAVGMIAVSLAFVGLQHHSTPKSTLTDYSLPTTVSHYKAVDAHTVGDGIVVGSLDTGINNPQLWNEILLANSWYVNDSASFQNTYTTIGFLNYARLTCVNYLGTTCPDLVNRLFTQRAATGLLLVDELSIDTVQMIKASVDQSVWSQPSPGWSITANGPMTVTWTRDHPVPRAGGPVQVSPGMSISDLHQNDTSVSFRADQVPSGGGGVTYSRLHWPGYTASNASIGSDVDGFLLHVDVPSSAQGKIVTISFTPPGWNLGLVTLTLGLLGGLVWSVLFEVRRRRTHAQPAQPSVH